MLQVSLFLCMCSAAGLVVIVMMAGNFYSFKEWECYNLIDYFNRAR